MGESAATRTVPSDAIREGASISTISRGPESISPTELVPGGVHRVLRRLDRRRTYWLNDPGHDLEPIVVASRFGEGCWLGARTHVKSSTVGDYSHNEAGGHISCADIGAFRSIAPHAVVGVAEHPYPGFVSSPPASCLHEPRLGCDDVAALVREDDTRTAVGNDVWIGGDARVLGGGSVGDGAIVGTGAVVPHDVPPKAGIAGVPAPHLQLPFDEKTEIFFLERRWSDQGIDWLQSPGELFADIEPHRANVNEPQTGIRS